MRPGTLTSLRNPPRPSRSFEEPDGLSTLKGLDLLRVGAANMLYAFAADFGAMFHPWQVVHGAEP